MPNDSIKKLLAHFIACLNLMVGLHLLKIKYYCTLLVKFRPRATKQMEQEDTLQHSLHESTGVGGSGWLAGRDCGFNSCFQKQYHALLLPINGIQNYQDTHFQHSVISMCLGQYSLLHSVSPCLFILLHQLLLLLHNVLPPVLWRPVHAFHWSVSRAGK